MTGRAERPIEPGAELCGALSDVRREFALARIWFLRASLLILSCLDFVPMANAQAEPARSLSTSSWTIYSGDHPLSRKWALHLEAGGFWHGFIGQRELDYVRPGVRRQLAHDVSVMVMYSHFHIEPLLTGRTAVAEHRIAGDVEWRRAPRVVTRSSPTLALRVRFEERMLRETAGGNGTAPLELRERLRLRTTLVKPAPWRTGGLRPKYIWTYDEVFLNLRSGERWNTVDQNLAAAGLGWDIAPHTQLELGYLNQYDPTPAPTAALFNHVLYIKVASSIPFFGKSRK